MVVSVEKKNQLDVTEWFITLMIYSTCFGHFYAHHQELETICVLLPPMVCSASDHYLVMAKVRERLAVRKQAAQKSDGEDLI